MAISNTPNRNYAWPEKDEDLESSNAFLRTTIFAIDTDIHAILTTKANSADVYTKAEVYTQAETDAAISSAVTTYNTGLTWTTGDVRGDSNELNLRTDTMAVPGAYSKVTVNEKGLVTAGSQAAKSDISDFVETDYLHLGLVTESAQGDYTFSGTVTFTGPVSLSGDVNVNAASIFDDNSTTSTVKGWTALKLATTFDDYVPLTSFTDAAVFSKILTQDGTGSGLDADLLDGQEGSYYLAWANFTGTPTTIAGYGITDAYTMTEVDTLVADVNTALTPAATVDIDFSLGEVFNLTLDQITTLTASNLVDGMRGSIILVQGGTGSYTVTWPTGFKFPGGTPPTLSTAVAAIDKIDFTINGTDVLCTFGLAFA